MKAILLLPFTFIYNAINIIWNLHWKIRKPVRVSARIISVGNIAVGGSGKTTVAGYIAQRLLSDGKKTAIVARGYARQEKEPIAVHSHDKLDWRKCGDEPAALIRTVEGLTVYVDSDKTAAAIRAAEDGYEFIIIDDGFQHRQLYRDIDIVCIEGKHPFGNGLLLPSGILREPKKALKRADIIIFIDSPSDKKSFPKKTSAQVFAACKKNRGIKSHDDIPVDLSGKKVVAFCGLGNPESFRKSLADCGCEIADFITFRDHHNYTQKNINYLVGRIGDTGSAGAVTTLKDLVKVEHFWDKKNDLYCLEMGIELENENKFFKLIRL